MRESISRVLRSGKEKWALYFSVIWTLLSGFILGRTNDRKFADRMSAFCAAPTLAGTKVILCGNDRPVSYARSPNLFAMMNPITQLSEPRKISFVCALHVFEAPEIAGPLCEEFS